jgi:signal transduction histidine kinase
MDQSSAADASTMSTIAETVLKATYSKERRSGLDEEGVELLMAIISSECERLARVIDDILLASHLDSGRLRFASPSVDVRALVADVVESMQMQAQKGTLRLEAPPNGLPAVSVDAIELRRVLQNLVDNAIKYSPEGGPVVVRVEAGDDGRVRLHVNDAGLGIPPSEQERIFDKFYRADPLLARGVGGAGLGLYICRELVQRMGGEIELESEPGKGSTFTVALPVRAAPTAASASRPRTVWPPRAS